ncbi:phage portal protein [Streptomyces albipurpureus]|uniref:Phage portal protein n=1 Tax=Streptomyces albipurpureus TaxID=2897419 RepID=A0ABT0UNJ8_9ACTN|nr:phage portal protein [Streptomyces sp. CWNU-1]MCM2390187.1 phage portal protein [Streptomyces sp. CWNU-1]
MPLIRRLLTGRSERSRKALPRLDGRGTSAGVSVTPEKALQVAAVFSSVRLLAETGSMLPCAVYERSGSTRRRIDEHPVAPLLTYQANPGLPSGEFWAQVLGWMLVRGNAGVYIERNNGGRPVGLWPISWTSVEPRRVPETGELVYKITLDDDEWAPIREADGLVRAENFLHFRAFGLSGVEGLSPIGMARQAVGTGWAATSYIGSFFQRDASPGGVVSVPGTLKDEQFERLTRQWTDLHEGFDNSHRLAVMEAGATWQKTTLSPADAQFLEVYKLTRAEIAGIFGVPPHMIGDVERSTSWGSGIEQMSLGYVIYSLMSWTTRLERTTQRLLGGPEAYLKFNPDALLRGDTTQRFSAYAQARQWGWMSVNDIRAKEDEPPIEGGDEYVVPLNMSPAGQTTPPEQRARPSVRAAAQVPSGAAMVALYPPADIAERLAVKGGLAAEELHITLAYLGKDLTDDQKATAAVVVAGVAAQHQILAGSIGGLGYFPPGDDGTTPYFATVDVPGLAELRHRLVDALAGAGVPADTGHGFTPHMTLTYLGDDGTPPQPPTPVDLGFTELTWATGPQRTAFPFSGLRARRRPPQQRRDDTAETPAPEEMPGWIQRHFEAISAFLAEQGERALAALNVSPGATADDIIDLAADNEVLTELLLQLARGLVAEVGTATASALGGSFVLEETTAVLAASAASTASNINSTTVEKLRSTINLGHAPVEVQASVRDMFDRMTESRARVLAQARVSSTTNFASHEGAKHAGAKTKTWRVWDANPRKTHARADGQTVGIRDTFTIGKHQGRWPHDHRLGVDEIAGCTCRLQFNL